MEDAFKKLQKEGKDTTDHLLTWMKETKVIGSDKKEQDKVKEMLNTASDKGKITYDKFKGVLEKLAEESKQNVQGLMAKMETGMTGLVNDLASKFK